MYRQYRYMPEVNRPCCRATRNREYQAHIDALNRIKSRRSTIDTSHPNVPQTIGRNYKRYEQEKQRNLQIRKDNMRLIGNMDRISREEHYPRAVPQRPYTLQGAKQKEEMLRITKENHKLLAAVQERKPILNRNDWLYHKIDHNYQVAKNSEYRQTLPYSEVMRQEIVRTGSSMTNSRRDQASASSRRAMSSFADSSSRKQKKHESTESDGELEQQTNERAEALMGSSDSGKKEQESDGELEQEANDRADALMGSSQKSNKSTSSKQKKQEEDEHESGDLNEKAASSSHKSASSRSKKDKESDGELEQETNERADALLSSSQKSNKSTSSKQKKQEEDEHESGDLNEKAASSSHKSASSRSKDKESDGELEQEANDRADALLGSSDKSNKEQESGDSNEKSKKEQESNKGELEQETNDRADALLGSSDKSNKEQESHSTPEHRGGALAQHASEIAGALFK